MNKNLKIITIISGVVVLAALIIIPKLKSPRSNEQTNASPAGKVIMTVNGFVVKPGKLDNVVRTTGTILAFEEVELASETSGRITKIYFTEGGHLNKGDLLVKINDDDLQAQLKKIEFQIKLAREQEGRQTQLLNISATSKQEYDIVVNQLNTLKADKDVIKATINKTEIRAPFNGVIGLKYVSEGSYVTPATRIASVQNINPLKIDFSIPEKYSGMVKKNDVVNFSIEETDQQITGKVYAIEPKIDLTTRTLQVRALCDNKSEKILPGSFAKIELQLKETSDALMIPTQALIPVLKGQTVFVSKGGVAQSIPVKTGVRTSAEIQIIDGLSAGDTIITTGINSLRPKTPVRVVLK